MRSECFSKKAERHRLVHELRKAGASYKEIADKVGVKSVTIWKYLKTSEPVVPPRRALSLTRQAEARAMKQAGASYSEIGKQFGVSAASACELIRTGPPEKRFGVCPLCHAEKELIPHHVNYITDERQFVCRACHTRVLHPQSLTLANGARADKRVDDKLLLLRFLGWSYLRVSIRQNGRRHIVGIPPNQTTCIEAPNPLRDLNILVMAERQLNTVQMARYVDELRTLGITGWKAISASADERSQCLLKILRAAKLR